MANDQKLQIFGDPSRLINLTVVSTFRNQHCQPLQTMVEHLLRHLFPKGLQGTPHADGVLERAWHRFVNMKVLGVCARLCKGKNIPARKSFVAHQLNIRLTSCTVTVTSPLNSFDACLVGSTLIAGEWAASAECSVNIADYYVVHLRRPTCIHRNADSPHSRH